MEDALSGSETAGLAGVELVGVAVDVAAAVVWLLLFLSTQRMVKLKTQKLVVINKEE